MRFTKNLFSQIQMNAATYKSTALKVLVLWNLPGLLLICGAFEIGTSIIA